MHRKNPKEIFLQSSQEEELYDIYLLSTIVWKMENTKLLVLHYLRQVCCGSTRKLLTLYNLNYNFCGLAAK